MMALGHQGTAVLTGALVLMALATGEVILTDEGQLPENIKSDIAIMARQSDSAALSYLKRVAQLALRTVSLHIYILTQIQTYVIHSSTPIEVAYKIRAWATIDSNISQHKEAFELQVDRFEQKINSGALGTEWKSKALEQCETDIRTYGIKRDTLRCIKDTMSAFTYLTTAKIALEGHQVFSEQACKPHYNFYIKAIQYGLDSIRD